MGLTFPEQTSYWGRKPSTGPSPHNLGGRDSDTPELRLCWGAREQPGSGLNVSHGEQQAGQPGPVSNPGGRRENTGGAGVPIHYSPR